MTHVLVVDDHPIILQGCRRVLQDIAVAEISEARSLACGYRRFLRARPDVVVTDLAFKGDDLGGLELVRRIAANDRRVRILVFSMHDDAAIISQALKNGATGYILKDNSSTELRQAIGAMLDGGPYLSHALALKVAMLRARSATPEIDGLTEREVQIVSLLGQGKSHDQIAAKLGISYKTVINATSLIRSKLKLASLAELIRFAIDNRSGFAS